jgi:hypothetical protein
VQYVNQDLTVRALGSYLSCSGTSTITTNLKYTWQVVNTGTGAVASYTSRVSAQNVFYLPKYTIAPGTFAFKVTVVRTDLPSSSSAVSEAVTVTIMSSGLTSSIYGGDVQSVRAGESISLDGSRSVDNDISDTTLATAGLTYAWHCNQTSPVVSSACTVLFESGTSVAKYTAPLTSIDSWNTITLVVHKDTRSATTSVSLHVVEASAAVLSISGTSVASGSKFVTSNKFTVSGIVSTEVACVATWSVASSVGSVDLSTVSGNVMTTLTTSVANYASDVSVSLVLAPNALPTMSTVQFALSCGSAVASVMVITNGPPQGGSFSVSPTTGVALSTNFYMTASSWVDDDTPLTYQFLVTSGGSLLELRRPLSVDNAVLNLPTPSSASGVVTAVMHAYDSYGAWSSGNFNVTVTTVSASALTSVLTSQLSVNVSTDVDGAKLAVTLVTASLNGASCGSGCSSDVVTQRQDIRNSLLTTLYSVSTADVIDTVSLTSMASSLAAITQVTSEISETGISGTFKVAQSLLLVANVSGVSLSQASVVNLLQSLSSVTVAGSVLANSTSGTVSFSLVESTMSMLSLVGSCNDIILNGMAFGEASISSVYDAFATTLISTTVSTGAVTASVTSATSSTSSVSIPVTGSVSVKMSSTTTMSWAYGSNRTLFSEAVSVSLSLTAGALTDGTRVVFVLPLTSAISSDVIPSAYSFTERCAYGEFRSITHECPDSGTEVTMNCTGGVEVLTAECPGQKQSASCGSAIGDSSLSCMLLDSTDSFLTCSCLLPSASRRRRLDTSVNSVLDQTGVSHVAALTEYVGEEFAGTLSSAADLNSAAAFRRVLIVIVAFIVLWSGGFAIVMSAAFRSKMHAGQHKEQAASFERMKRYAQATRSPVAISEYLRNYVDEVFPSAFKDKPNLECLFDEIYKHHRYVLVVACSNDKKSDQNRIVTGVRLLTIQTMLMFLLAVFYDLQAPSDDGTCKTLLTEDSCLARKSVIEAHSTYCQWSENALREMECSYQDPVFSYLTIAYVSVLISVITAFVTSPIDMCFQYLTAPTADSIKLSAADTFTNRLVERAKRASISTMNMMSNSVSRMTDIKKRLGQVNFETREVPESTRLAHGLAMAVVPFLISKSQSMLLKRVASTQSSKEKHKEARDKLTKEHGDDSDDSEDEKESGYESSSDGDESESGSDHDHGSRSDDKPQRLSQRSSQRSDDKMPAPALAHTSRGYSFFRRVLFRENPVVQKKFDELSLEIDLQRKVLRGTDAEDFDNSWGIDPTGEFVKRDRLSVTGYHHYNAAETIKEEIREVDKESTRIFEYLRYATDQHIGLEILHLFVLDILGRKTAAARIFEAKSREDFFTVRVVSRRSQMLAWCGFIFLNLFFVYFTVLKSYEKGVGWQRAFVAGCVIQILVEVFFNETIECLWVNFLVPRLVSEEVHKVATILHTAISQLCVSDANADPSQQNHHHVLDAPSYLFVSTSVARKFPSMLESMVVRAYQSHMPGMLANKWHFGPVSRIDRSRGDGFLGFLRTISLTATILTGLQVAAASPFIFQRVIIRIAQPWLLTGIVVAAAYLVNEPIVLSVFCVVVAAVLAVLIYRTFFKKTEDKKTGKVSDERRLSSDNISGEQTGDDNSGEGTPERERSPAALRPVSAGSIVIGDVADNDSISQRSDGSNSSIQLSACDKFRIKIHGTSCNGDIDISRDGNGNDDDNLSSSISFSLYSGAASSVEKSIEFDESAKYREEQKDTFTSRKNVSNVSPAARVKRNTEDSISVDLFNHRPDDSRGDDTNDEEEEEEHDYYGVVFSDGLVEHTEAEMTD